MISQKSIRFLLTIFSISASVVYSQIATVRVMDRETGHPIENVYCLDSVKNVFLTTGKAGIVTVENGRNSFVTSHIGYEPAYFEISKLEKDTAFDMYLNKKTNFLANAIISSGTKKHRIIEVKVFAKKKSSRVMVKGKAKVGIVVMGYDTLRHHELMAIKFRIGEMEFKGAPPFSLQMKLYGIHHDTLSMFPINYSPIYLSSKDTALRVLCRLSHFYLYPSFFREAVPGSLASC